MWEELDEQAVSVVAPRACVLVGAWTLGGAVGARVHNHKTATEIPHVWLWGMASLLRER